MGCVFARATTKRTASNTSQKPLTSLFSAYFVPCFASRCHRGRDPPPAFSRGLSTSDRLTAVVELTMVPDGVVEVIEAAAVAPRDAACYRRPTRRSSCVSSCSPGGCVAHRPTGPRATSRHPLSAMSICSDCWCGYFRIALISEPLSSGQA